MRKWAVGYRVNGMWKFLTYLEKIPGGLRSFPADQNWEEWHFLGEEPVRWFRSKAEAERVAAGRSLQILAKETLDRLLVEEALIELTKQR